MQNKVRVRLYKEYHSVCPLVGIGTLPTPLSPASVPLPPEPEGAHLPAEGGGGGGGVPNPTTREKLSTLPTLCHAVYVLSAAAAFTGHQQIAALWMVTPNGQACHLHSCL
jgi:hypothetical protein